MARAGRARYAAGEVRNQRTLCVPACTSSRFSPTCPDRCGETFIGADTARRDARRVLLDRAMVTASWSSALRVFSPPTRYTAAIDRRIGYAQVLEERFPRLEDGAAHDLPEFEDDAYAAALASVPRKGSTNEIHAAYHVGAGTYGLARAPPISVTAWASFCRARLTETIARCSSPLARVRVASRHYYVVLTGSTRTARAVEGRAGPHFCRGATARRNRHGRKPDLSRGQPARTIDVSPLDQRRQKHMTLRSQGLIGRISRYRLH